MLSTALPAPISKLASTLTISTNCPSIKLGSWIHLEGLQRHNAEKSQKTIEIDIESQKFKHVSHSAQSQVAKFRPSCAAKGVKRGPRLSKAESRARYRATAWDPRHEKALILQSLMAALSSNTVYTSSSKLTMALTFLTLAIGVQSDQFPCSFCPYYAVLYPIWPWNTFLKKLPAGLDVLISCVGK